MLKIKVQYIITLIVKFTPQIYNFGIEPIEIKM